MRDFNAQMIATPKLEGVAKKHIFLDGLQMWVMNVLFKFPNLPKDMAWIIKIAKNIDSHGSKKKLSCAPQQSGLSQNLSRQRAQEVTKTNWRYNSQQRSHPKKKATQCLKQIKW
jgi:hypothetical protein